MAKPPVRVIPSDDFVVEVDGIRYVPHEGETVTFLPTIPISMLQATQRMGGLSTQLDALRDENGELSDSHASEVRAVLSTHYADLLAITARVVHGWTWTDDAGTPLPAPDGTPGPLETLSEDELYYLWRSAQGRNEAARKNGLRP